METDSFIMKIFPQNGRKLESEENKYRNIFIQYLVFNNTIIPLTLVGYENLVRYLKAHPTRFRGIIVNYSTQHLV